MRKKEIQNARTKSKSGAGVRTDVPFRELTDKEKDIVFHGPAVKKNIIYQNKTGGEAQRLKLASEMGKGQSNSVFVFDEPTIGLHPLDVRTLLGVFKRLIENGATVIVIEHDLDVIRNADYIIDMGPGGGVQGGQIIARGTPEEICGCGSSKTGNYLKKYLTNDKNRNSGLSGCINS